MASSSSSSSRESYRSELRIAIRQLADRCLYSASKWAAEQLVGIEQDSGKFTPSHHARFYRSSSSSTARTRRFRTPDVVTTPLAGVSYVTTPVFHDDQDDVTGNDYFLLAKSYFDCREYRRAAHALRDQTGKKAVFLRCYALYLSMEGVFYVKYSLRNVEPLPSSVSCIGFHILNVSPFHFSTKSGEKRKEEEIIELEGPSGKGDVVNNELVSLERELSALRKSGAIDSFGLYLYGVVLREKGREDLARTVLVESVNNYPWNWSAWTELQSLCTTLDLLNSLNLKNHWMKEFFLGSAYQELKMYNEALTKYEYLQGTFRYSDYIQAQIATAQYSLRELDEADVLFEELLRNDPYRIDSMDVYSNVLYAKESFSALSYLAHRVFLTDKYRPESCCIVGNYYSLKGLHEKSVMYFRRALKLNRKYLSAWTLMGHEYVEMKNTPAAIDAYRRAVDINPRDYRAWYGLGQTYEMMSMPFYALYYFRKSAYLQPTDARLWNAMAQCYQSEQLHMLEEAIKCYRRAANCNDREGIALHQLAKLYTELGHLEQAAFYYKMDLERMQAEERDGPNLIEALLFLAKHSKAEKRFEEAEMYCTRLLDYTGPEKETAKSLLRGMRLAQSGFPSMDVEHFAP
ncbi:anaphase-promoting complex subunit 8 [Cinnamomum micranthum f. kanehirae]|uniref:Anaphase-promoting complex subunit 8 n=1 Tax=Cinnamomum micranthum f. kanehirae TaxID=337451 RepID=A0A3S4P9H3_9MAGN|nr:anaphase-promoting complex subunit 8 [Cinnamomum micranthum f. kanehirae]